MRFNQIEKKCSKCICKGCKNISCKFNCDLNSEMEKFHCDMKLNICKTKIGELRVAK
jgi:hypothetical protein